MIAMEGHASDWHGYRLVKLELFNWGTFDSTNGAVHSVRPEGATTLLIGQNGSGKSTMVDALLTLLVRPVVRNYNVAAGAQKQERDERSYIKGACGRLGRDDDNRAEIQYLRRDGNHYSAILGCFRNELGAVITLAQVLFLDGENAPQKVYCFAEREMSIAEHCAGLASPERLRQQMEKRGFRATNTYADYHKWFVRATEDSAGQSGGEKAKLAFTILVAAIAYQYDIDPSHPASNRFGFVVVDEMFSKVDDHYSDYALQLFAKFGLQLLIVAPLDAKARVTEPYVGSYLHAVKDENTSMSEIFSMTAREFEEAILAGASEAVA